MRKRKLKLVHLIAVSNLCSMYIQTKLSTVAPGRVRLLYPFNKKGIFGSVNVKLGRFLGDQLHGGLLKCK